MKMLIIPKSSNAKTGNLIQSYSSRSTCPESCPFKKNGCYADNYHVSMVWNRCDNPEDKRYIHDEHDLIASLTSAVAEHARTEDVVLFRHNVAGDMALPNSDYLDRSRVDTMVKACNLVGITAQALNVEFKAYTYTHCKMNDQNIEIIKKSNDNGFLINVSCETPDEVLKAHENGLPSVITSVDPDATILNLAKVGIKAVQCPSQTKGITCKKCKLCARKRNTAIIFGVHGTNTKKAKKVIMLKLNASK